MFHKRIVVGAILSFLLSSQTVLASTAPSGIPVQDSAEETNTLSGTVSVVDAIASENASLTTVSNLLLFLQMLMINYMNTVSGVVITPTPGNSPNTSPFIVTPSPYQSTNYYLSAIQSASQGVLNIFNGTDPVNNLGDKLQNLKDFYALMDLQHIQGEAELRMMTPPNTELGRYLGSKVGAAEVWVEAQANSVGSIFDEWNSYTASNYSTPEAAIVRYTQLYCSTLDADNNICTHTPPTMGGPITEEDAIPNDYNAPAILGSDVFNDVGEEAVAVDFIRNATSMTPPSLLPPAQMFANQTSPPFTNPGIKNLTAVHSFQLLASTAQAVLFDMYAERLPLPDSAAETLASIAGPTLPLNPQGQTSILALLNYEADRRYTDPNWHTEVDTLSAEALLREQVKMQSYSNYLLYRNSQQNDKILFMLAMVVGNLANTASQMQAAQQAGQQAQSQNMGLP